MSNPTKPKTKIARNVNSYREDLDRLRKVRTNLK